jgi:hypothetical protein
VRTRRKVLSTLAALAVSASTVAALTSSSAEAAVPATIPLTITNNSGRNDAVYLYVLGESLTTHRLGYADASGQFREWGAGGVPPTPAPDVSIPGPARGQSTTIQIPKLSGRVYMSFGEKLKFFLTPTGLVQPAPWNPSDPNRDILFDWSEYTLNDAGLWLNSSQVDMFAVPHAVRVTSASGARKTAGELVSGGRNRILDAIRNQPGDWARLIHTRSDGTVLRAFAPGKAIEQGLFDPNYYNAYVNQVYDVYRSTTLTVVPFQNQPDTRYFGRTEGETLVFRNASNQVVARFDKPSTANIFGCDGRLAAPNDPVVGPIARTLCAGYNRSTLHDISTQPSYDPSRFYTTAITNHYSRTIHNHMVDGRAYGFPFDDVGAFESLVHDPNPSSAEIVLTPF